MVFSKVKKAFSKKPLPVSERMIKDAQKMAAAEQKRKDEAAIKQAYAQARQEARIAQAKQRGKASAVPLSQRIGTVAQNLGGGQPSKGRSKKATTGSGLLDLVAGPTSKPPTPKPKGKGKPKGAAVKINVGGQIITVHQKTKKKPKAPTPKRAPNLEDLLKGGGLF